MKQTSKQQKKNEKGYKPIFSGLYLSLSLRFNVIFLTTPANTTWPSPHVLCYPPPRSSVPPICLFSLFFSPFFNSDNPSPSSFLLSLFWTCQKPFSGPANFSLWTCQRSPRTRTRRSNHDGEAYQCEPQAASDDNAAS